jgi:hypothetical protein
MHKDQAEAILETFDGKVPNQLTFTFPDDDAYLTGCCHKCNIDEPTFDVSRYTLLQQALWSFYMMHEFSERCGLMNDHAYLLGTIQIEPSESDAQYIDMFKFYASPELMSFMFWEPFMKFVGAHCNSNVLCIYYRLPYFNVIRKNDPETFEDDIVKILKLLGDNGTYNWISQLLRVYDGSLQLSLSLSMTEYMIQSPKFALYIHCMNNKALVPENFHVGTLTYISNKKRKRQ